MRPQNNRGPQNAHRTHEKSAQTGDDPIRNAQIGSAFPAAIENQQLMSDQRGFSNDRTKPTGPRKSNEGDDYMKKKSEDVAHGGMVSNVKKTAIQGNWGIRHVQAGERRHRRKNVRRSANTARTLRTNVKRAEKLAVAASG